MKLSQQYNFSIKLRFEFANSEFCNEQNPKAARMERIPKWNREGEKRNHEWDLLQPNTVEVHIQLFIYIEF